MMGETALRYPHRSLVVSTGTYEGSAASDARFPQVIDRVGIRATRLRTVQGLALWTWRASSLAKRWKPGFTWCAELKPAAYPARWLTARQGIPYGVIVHGTELLLIEAKIRRSRFKRRTAGSMIGQAAVIVANSRWTADLAREVLGLLDLAVPVETVPLGTTPSHFRPGVDPAAVRAKYGLNGGPWLITVARLESHKGIDTTIRALPAVRAVHPNTRYAVVGTGDKLPNSSACGASSGSRMRSALSVPSRMTSCRRCTTPPISTSVPRAASKGSSKASASPSSKRQRVGSPSSVVARAACPMRCATARPASS